MITPASPQALLSTVILLKALIRELKPNVSDARPMNILMNGFAHGDSHLNKPIENIKIPDFFQIALYPAQGNLPSGSTEKQNKPVTYFPHQAHS